ncbi:hypothetical protein VNO77_04438 [Canavalia gladiata]|uniref:Uncharacterized protein n=1 Tax=Canavalia gladiata TaxID=3824 RepID=A0AAN9RD71_CANGL
MAVVKFSSWLLVWFHSMAKIESSSFKKIQLQRDDTRFDVYVVGKEDAFRIVVIQDCRVNSLVAFYEIPSSKLANLHKSRLLFKLTLDT